MKRSSLIVICAAVFALIGLVAGSLTIVNLPALADPDYSVDVDNRVELVCLLALGSTIGGAALGVVVGIFAAVFGPKVPAEQAGEGTRTIAQPYARK
jgi:hypothetical protein